MTLVITQLNRHVVLDDETGIDRTLFCTFTLLPMTVPPSMFTFWLNTRGRSSPLHHVAVMPDLGAPADIRGLVHEGRRMGVP